MASLADMFNRPTTPSVDELMACFTKKRMAQELHSVLRMHLTNYDKSSKLEVFKHLQQDWGNLKTVYMQKVSRSAGPMAPSGIAGGADGDGAPAGGKGMGMYKGMGKGIQDVEPLTVGDLRCLQDYVGFSLHNCAMAAVLYNKIGNIIKERRG